MEKIEDAVVAAVFATDLDDMTQLAIAAVQLLIDAGVVIEDKTGDFDVDLIKLAPYSSNVKLFVSGVLSSNESRDKEH